MIRAAVFLTPAAVGAGQRDARLRGGQRKLPLVNDKESVCVVTYAPSTAIEQSKAGT